MKAVIQFSDIESVISFCLHPEKGGIDIFSFPWVYEKLSWFSRFLGYCGGKKRSQWLEKHLFPILLEVSIPHLESFLGGEWTISEESSLKNIFDYFAVRIDACRQKISPSLETFLMGPTPSFFQERVRIQSQRGDRQGFQWYKEETYSQYKNRMNNLFYIDQKKERSVFSDNKNEKEIPKPEPEQKERPHQQKTKERIETFIGKFQEIKEECVRYNYQLDKDLSKVFPLRNEYGSIVEVIQEIKEELMDLLLLIEEELSKLIEFFAMMLDEKVYIHFDEVEAILKSFRATFRYIQKRSEENRVFIEEKKTSLNKRIQEVIRSVDKIQMLPVSSAFRVHQLRLVRMARDRIKTFRDDLVKGPGPSVPLSFLEKDIFLLIELAKDFYAEGHEVELMQEQLAQYSKNIEKMIEKKGSTSILKNILSDITELRRTLEVSADRKRHFDKIILSLSKANIHV